MTNTKQGMFVEASSTHINAWFLAEFLTLCITEVVVRIKGGVQGRYQVKEGLGGNRVTEVALALHRAKTLAVRSTKYRIIHNTKYSPNHIHVQNTAQITHMYKIQPKSYTCTKYSPIHSHVQNKA